MFGATPAFGAASTPAFGAASPAPSLFGASTPAFGAASTPAFGATSIPAFGAASTPAFGAASTPAFGAASTPAFGAASTPAFGAALPSTAPQGSPFSFAPAAASAPSPFGAAPAASPFGAASSAAAGFSFSSAPALFGAASQPTSLFGAAPAASQPASLFGAAPAAPASFTAAPLQPDFSAVRELVALRDAFVPDSDKFRLQSLFLNVVPNPAARVKPPGVDDLRWREALQRCGGTENADGLWPVAARGFQDLVARKEAQETIARERVETIKRRHLELMHALLRLMRRLDGVESRVAGAMGNYDAAGAARIQRQLEQQLAALQERVLSTSAAGLQRGVESLVAAAHMSGGLPSGAYALQGTTLDEQSLTDTFHVLSQHTQALCKLQDVLAKAERDLAVLSAVPDDTLLFAAPGR